MLTFPLLSSRYVSIPDEIVPEEITYTLEELDRRFKELKAKRPEIYPDDLRTFINGWIEYGFIRPI